MCALLLQFNKNNIIFIVFVFLHQRLINVVFIPYIKTTYFIINIFNDDIFINFDYAMDVLIWQIQSTWCSFLTFFPLFQPNYQTPFFLCWVKPKIFFSIPLQFSFVMTFLPSKSTWPHLYQLCTIIFHPMRYPSIILLPQLHRN